jgi:hypothetical protein
MDVSICGASARLSRWRIRRCTDRTGSKTMEVSVWHSYCCTDGAFQATLSCGPRHRHHHGEASDSFAALQHLPGRQGLSSCFVGSLAHADAPPRVHAGLRRSSEATTGSPTPCAGQSTAQPHYEAASPSKPIRQAEPVAPFASIIGRDYAAAISRVALIGSFRTLHRADRFTSRGRPRSVSHT